VEQVHALLYHEVFDTLDLDESPELTGAPAHQWGDGAVHGLGRIVKGRSFVPVLGGIPNASARPPSVSVDSSAFSGLRANSSGNTKRRKAQNRNASAAGCRRCRRR
jgi:hypothetical protein